MGGNYQATLIFVSPKKKKVIKFHSRNLTQRINDWNPRGPDVVRKRVEGKQIDRAENNRINLY